MTSNLGSEYILENNNDSKNLIMNSLKQTFKPEFINRIDEIVIFNSLSKEVVNDIIDKIIIDLELRLKDKHLKIKLTDKAKDYILENAYDEVYGARPIKRFINHHIETMLANAIINDKIKINSEIIIDVKDNKLILNI